MSCRLFVIPPSYCNIFISIGQGFIIMVYWLSVCHIWLAIFVKAELQIHNIQMCGPNQLARGGLFYTNSPGQIVYTHVCSPRPHHISIQMGARTINCIFPHMLYMYVVYIAVSVELKNLIHLSWRKCVRFSERVFHNIHTYVFLLLLYRYVANVRDRCVLKRAPWFRCVARCCDCVHVCVVIRDCADCVCCQMAYHIYYKAFICDEDVVVVVVGILFIIEMFFIGGLMQMDTTQRLPKRMMIPNLLWLSTHK